MVQKDQSQIVMEGKCGASSAHGFIGMVSNTPYFRMGKFIV